MKFKNMSKSRSLTKKELILIFILFMMGIGYLIFNYALLPKWDEYKAAENNFENVQIRCNALKKEYKKLDELKKEEENLKYSLTRLIEQLPPYISQENIILTIDKYAKDNEIQIKALSLDDEKSAEANSVINKEYKSELEELFKTDEELANDKSTQGDAENKVLIKYVDLSFIGKISSLFNFIDQLEENEHKLFVKELSINSSRQGTLMGNLRIQYIGYKDKSSNTQFELDIPEIDGKVNPFQPYEGYQGNSNKYVGNDGIAIDMYDPDFNLILSYNDDDMPNFIMSEYRKAETEIYSSVNNTIEGKITISEEGDKFSYTYSLGNASKSQVKNFNFQERIIRMEVYSHSRISEEDKMKIVLDVENNTDLLVDITIVNDDYDDPLFELGETVGNVNSRNVNR